MDKHYQFCLENYDFFDEEDKVLFELHRNDSFEEWANHVATSVYPYNENMQRIIIDLEFQIDELSQGEYKLCLPYWGGTKNKIYIQHNSDKCGNNKFWVMPSSFFYQGTRCPICNESKGEWKIRKFLENNCIIFKSQHYFQDLCGKNNSKLRFDFAIFNKDETLKCLVEFDGIYHYEINNRNNTSDLEEQKYRDNLKTQYCSRHNIRLLRIPYWEFDNINKILEENI